MSKIIDIKREALKHYEGLLSAYLTGKDHELFPLELKYSKPQKLDDRQVIKEKIDYLEKHSKARLGYGFEMEWETTASRKWNEWNIPKRVFFRSREEYLKFISKENEFSSFIQNVNLISDKIPELIEWIYSNPFAVANNNHKWAELLSVCNYFMKDHIPDVHYVRELPIPNIHTKFIEDNEAIVRKLLDHLIPSKINKEVKDFHNRFYLKNKERLIRVRILCPELKQVYIYNDFSIKFSDFKEKEISCSSIVIAENELNFLTFPDKSGFIALWNGGGHNIHDLPKVQWLKEKKVYYFGDLDVAGLDILSKFRKHYPLAQSILMNKLVFELFQDGRKSDKTINPKTEGLNDTEIELLNILKPNNLRLEQERIPQLYINKVIEGL